MKRKTMLLFLILGIVLLIPIYSSAQIIDPDPINMSGAARWEYRDFGNYGASHHIGGDQQRKGAYFRFESTIVTGGFLDKIEDVIYVVARNTGTNKRYFLHYDPYVWIGTFMDSWFFVRATSRLDVSR